MNAAKWEKVMIYGHCPQCKYMDPYGVCPIKKGIVGYLDRCGRFKIAEGVKESDLLEGWTWRRVPA